MDSRYQSESFQNVRLIDVFVLGPAMISVALASNRVPTYLRIIVGIGGLLTIVFNGLNYLDTRKK